jgi:hypothetical protein
MPSLGERFRVADLSAELFDGGFIVLPEPRPRIDERLAPSSLHIFTVLRPGRPLSGVWVTGATMKP